MMKKTTLMALAAAILTFSAHPAAAVKLTNLDTVAHTVTINNAGEAQQITLEPGRSYTTYGPMVDIVMKNKKPKRARWDEDYTIWPGGKLILQRIRGNYND